MKLTFVVLVANIMRQFQQREEVCKAATSEGLLGDYLRHTFKFFVWNIMQPYKKIDQFIWSFSSYYNAMNDYMTLFSPCFACRALLF